MKFFVLSYTRGANWIEGKPLHQQPLQEHLAHLSRAYQQSHLVMAGPFQEVSGGMAIVQVPSLDEAKAIADSDPGVLAGALQVQVREWRPIVWERMSTGSVAFAEEAVEVRFVPSTSGRLPE